MDLQKKAKIQSERELEPSKSVGEKFLAGDPPASARPEDSLPQASDDERREKIRNRAYAIWLDQGQGDGRDHEHWIEAEREIDAEEEKARKSE